MMAPTLSLDSAPYKYQTQVRDKFLAGQNLVIQAPTGAGKTRAALEPGIIGFQSEPAKDYPQRIIYNVPMRVLGRGFFEEYTKRAAFKRWEPHWYPTIQTGESPDDPLFEGHVIFCTVDQMLASFLNIPYGLPKRLDNINAGAMIGSTLIFDEFHLYPRDQMMLTVLALLKMLKGLSRFILMSATFSPVFLKEIARVLGADMIADEPGTPLAASRFGDIKALTTRKRTFYAEEGSLTAGAVRARIGNAQGVLCICNTVDRAQQLYQALCHELGGSVECRLLHSRFYQEDRRAIESFVLERLKEQSARQVILVATQVVEVGLDITSEVLLTECAPAASLIQRAGRCARRAGETGRVYVFQPYDDEGQVNYAPYLENGQETICHKTWNSLCSDEFNGKVMGFPQEQRLVEIAHGQADQAFIARLEDKIDQRIEEITKCMATRHEGYADKLIRERDANMAPLHIDANPNQDDRLTKHPWQREALSISKGRLARVLEQMPAPNELNADFLFCAGIEQAVDDYTSVYSWSGVRDKQDIYVNWRFVAHPNVVTYTPEIGLVLCPSDSPAKESPDAPPKIWEHPRYEAERYHEHINGLQLAYRQPRTARRYLSSGKTFEQSYTALHDELVYPLRCLCGRLGEDPIRAERLLRLSLALHDVGKLNAPWQMWARAWQRFRQEHGHTVTLPLDDLHPLAHTDFDSGDEPERELQRGFKHAERGPHAGESAEACLPILWEATDGDPFWMAVLVGAIMRHHTPDVDSAGTFRLASGSNASLIRALNVLGFEPEAARWAGMLPSGFDRGSQALRHYAQQITPTRSRYDAALMYFLFVRTLRLADQRSGFYWRQYRATNLVSNYEK